MSGPNPSSLNITLIDQNPAGGEGSGMQRVSQQAVGKRKAVYRRKAVDKGKAVDTGGIIWDGVQPFNRNVAGMGAWPTNQPIAGEGWRDVQPVSQTAIPVHQTTVQLHQTAAGTGRGDTWLLNQPVTGVGWRDGHPISPKAIPVHQTALPVHQTATGAGWSHAWPINQTTAWDSLQPANQIGTTSFNQIAASAGWGHAWPINQTTAWDGLQPASQTAAGMGWGDVQPASYNFDSQPPLVGLEAELQMKILGFALYNSSSDFLGFIRTCKTIYANFKNHAHLLLPVFIDPWEIAIARAAYIAWTRSEKLSFIQTLYYTGTLTGYEPCGRDLPKIINFYGQYLSKEARSAPFDSSRYNLHMIMTIRRFHMAIQYVAAELAPRLRIVPGYWRVPFTVHEIDKVVRTLYIIDIMTALFPLVANSELNEFGLENRLMADSSFC
ncbi:hypothetical protein SAMD00023353_3401150 [Rosellinia necatrix]|uniref:Uncharacterized protein n=1 Tax=Rosellinia necatrix TaxID=77044 RepID=A0A1S8A8T4_ROSNE|nr:hypothetical protein SAMD00023353_3401150 [Rosellinia necatrix]